MFQNIAFISGGEILIILFIIVILFGADKLPGIARTIGKGYYEVNKAAEEIKSELKKEQISIKKDIEDIKKSVSKEETTKEDKNKEQ